MKRTDPRYCNVCKVLLTPENRYGSNLLCHTHDKERVLKHTAKAQKTYFQTSKGRLAANKASKRAAKKYPEKWIARSKLRQAVKKGEIVRPDVCDVSKFKGATPCKEGQIQAHHHRGYIGDHAFDVLWLCSRHHADAHLSLKKQVETL